MQQSTMGYSINRLAKLFDLLITGTANLNPSVTWVMKMYVLICTLFSIVSHTFVMINYTLKVNGGIININFLIHNLMQFLLVVLPGQRFTSDQIACLLTRANQEKLQLYKATFILVLMTFLAFTSLSSVIVFTLNRGTDQMYVMAYGFERSRAFDPMTETFLLAVVVCNLGNIFWTLFIFSSRYAVLLYATSLLAQQNLHFMDSLEVKCHLGQLNPAIFNRVDQMYLMYRRIVDKVNAAYGKVPFWFLMVFYANITSFGTLLVLLNGQAVLVFVNRNVSSMATILAGLLGFIHLSNKGYHAMELFRQKGLRLINWQIKRNKTKDPMCECLSNTFRGVKVTRMKAAQIYNMEHSILISLIASAIPTTVMVVSLLREL